MTLRVPEWNDFENSKSKHIRRLDWIPMPNKFGLIYLRLVKGAHGPAHFGVWCAIIEYLSNQDKDNRNGWLTHNGKPKGIPLCGPEIAGFISMDLKVVERAIAALLTPEIGWLVEENPPTVSHQSPTDTPPTPLNRIEGNEASKSSATEAAPQTEIYITQKKRKLTGPALVAFNQFWSDYDYKHDKARAADAWMAIDWPKDRDGKNALFQEIRKGAKAEAVNRRWVSERGGTPRYAEKFLSHKGWEDEQ